MITTALLVYLAMILVATIASLTLIIKTSGKHRRLKQLSGFGFVLIIAGIVLAGEPLLGYGLMGIGILITVLGILKVNKLRSRWP